MIDYDRDSILHSVKKLMGIHHQNTAFDEDVIAYINSVFAALMQFKIGEGIIVTGETEKWSDYFNPAYVGMMTDYVASKARTKFDPPMSSSAEKALEENIKELEFRLLVAIESEVLLKPMKED